MKHSGKLFLAILSFSLLSYGISSAAYAAAEPISVTTNKEWYADGATITISGIVKDFDISDPMTSMDVSITIWAPNGNLATIAQISPSSDGNYSTTVKAAGMINVEGDYTVKVKWGAQSNERIFAFGGGTSTPTTESGEQDTTIIETIDEAPDEATDEEPESTTTEPVCGPGTVLENNVCVAEQQKKGGGCLIATAAFGSEMAPQVQFLREIRDNTVLQTESGSAFMTGFNQFYYSFSPVIADYERENIAFKETVKIAITPMLTSLAILNYVDIDSEEEMLGYGIGIILLNIGMYFVAPAVVIFKIRNRK
jgi:hypothetical protein